VRPAVRQRRGIAATTFGLAALVGLLLALLTPADGTAAGGCDAFASPRGFDGRGDGSLRRPFRSPTKLLAALRPGQIGCFRGGRYRFSEVRIATPDITLTSYLSERVSLRGAIKIPPAGAGAIVEGMRLNGAGGSSDIGPKIYADDVILRDNVITNDHTDICVLVSRFYSHAAPRNVVIRHNRIHDCGELPSTNLDHGIYLSGAVGAVIKDNLIYDNADRGIQLYPAPRGTVISGNVIDGNGSGMVISGLGGTTSDQNLIHGNIIANSNVSWNVRSGRDGPGALVNVVADNCVFATNRNRYYDSNGGIESPSRNFLAIRNVIANPRYRNAAADDFRLSRASGCLRSYTGTMALPGAPPPGAR